MHTRSKLGRSIFLALALALLCALSTACGTSHTRPHASDNVDAQVHTADGGDGRDDHDARTPRELSDASRQGSDDASTHASDAQTMRDAELTPDRDASIDASRDGAVGGPCAYPSFVSSMLPAPDTMFGPGQSDGRDALPEIVCGPPLEPAHGTVHTASLGNGGRIVVGFARAIIDGPGVDFIVFENPFSASYPELGTVAVSADGATWYAYPCDAKNPSAGGNYGTCAGWHVVHGARGDAPSTWIDPKTAGGDQFDLADLSLPPEVTRIRYVRITDRVDDDTHVFDLDAVSIVHGAND